MFKRTTVDSIMSVFTGTIKKLEAYETQVQGDYMALSEQKTKIEDNMVEADQEIAKAQAAISKLKDIISG